MSIEITDHFKNLIDLASREAAKNILSSMSATFKEDMLFEDTDKRSQTYIVASSLSHLKDAWCYFGESVNAVLKNDVSLSKHFSYYSELRSALSLMATEGIGIYDGEHYFIDNNENVQQFKRQSGMINKLGTHQMIWTSMEAWSMLPKSRELLEKIIQIEGISLKRWVEACNYAKWSGLSYEIYKIVGIDLKHIAYDREMRNNVSYLPTDIFESSCSVEENIKFVCKIWDLLEPDFKSADLNILKQSLGLIECERHSIVIEKLIDNDDIQEELVENIHQLDDTVFQKSSIIYENIDDALNDPENHLQILGRAFLLLRIATGSVKLLLKDANIEFSEISFWTNRIITEYGLIDNDVNLEMFSDMWVDIDEEALQHINEYNIEEDFFSLKRKLSYPFSLLCETQRPLLWGIEY